MSEPRALNTPTGAEAFQWALIRVVPRVERGECINAGVIVYSKRLRYLGARVELDEARLVALAPAVDVAAARAALTAFERACNAGPHAGKTISERFNWLTAPRSAMVQPGPVHGGVTADPGAELYRLFGALVRNLRRSPRWFATWRDGQQHQMPELPDVEGFRTVLAEHGAGRQVERVEVADAGVLRDVSAQHLQRSLRGRRFRDPERHGKWLIARTDGPALLMHFGMTGQLHWAQAGQQRHRHDRVVFTLPDGELRFRDMRKLQGITLAQRPGDVGRVLGDIGPDALSIGQQEFADALGAGRQAVKAALLDQSVIAGLGNLLGDEILWRACINPRRPVRQLTPGERERLHGQMRQVLREAIPASRVPAQAGWLTGSRNEDDAACPRCGTPLEKDRVSGRSTVWCPCCQSAEPGPCCEPH